MGDDDITSMQNQYYPFGSKSVLELPTTNTLAKGAAANLGYSSFIPFTNEDYKKGYDAGLAMQSDDSMLDSVFGDKYMMGNIAGLASTLMQAAALPSMLKQAKLQNKALSQNIETAKEEQGRRRKNISAFNAFRG